MNYTWFYNIETAFIEDGEPIIDLSTCPCCGMDVKEDTMKPIGFNVPMEGWKADTKLCIDCLEETKKEYGV